MEYNEFLKQVIDKGIEAAKRDYNSTTQESLKAGSIAGFEACRDKTPYQLSKLLKTSRSDTEVARHEHAKNARVEYWFIRGYELEVEWVCNVVSAMLMNTGEPTLITPTARGVLAAADIIGIAKVKSS